MPIISFLYSPTVTTHRPGPQIDHAHAEDKEGRVREERALSARPLFFEEWHERHEESQSSIHPMDEGAAAKEIRRSAEERGRCEVRSERNRNSMRGLDFSKYSLNVLIFCILNYI